MREATTPKLRRRWPPLRLLVAAGSLIALAAVLVLPASLPYVLRVEHFTSDLRVAHLSPRLPGPHPRVAMVTITEATFPALKFERGSPTNRAMLAEILRRLDAVGACAIGIDFIFRSPTAHDETLLAQIKGMRTPVILGAVDVRTSGVTAEQLAFQRRFFAAAGRPAGFLNLRSEPEDSTVRLFSNPADRAEFPASLAVLAARTVKPDASDPYRRRISWLRPPPQGDTFLTVPAHELPAAVDGQGQAQPCDVATAGAGAAGLANRIVLLGADLPPLDRHRTPFSPGLQEQQTGLFIHAQMAADIVDSDWRAIREFSVRDSTLMQIGLAIFGFLMGWRFSTATFAHSLGWSAGTAGLLAVGLLCFVVWHLVLPFAVAFFTWFLAVTAGRSSRASLAWLRRNA